MVYTTELNPPQRILLGPGPSNCHPRVLRSMSTPLVGHLDPSFVDDWEAATDDGARLRVVIDQVASLTDASAAALHARLLGSTA